jgi:demethylmenaquinone methyltransferase/2-methoxy-6-polyprenyl-1,4-benzoquinol methylase
VFDHFRYLAPFYDRLLGPPDADRLARILKLPVAGRILDSGGGTGRLTRALRPLAGQVVVADPSAHMLARARGKRLAAVAARSERLPFAGACFERILVVDALHHFGDQHAALAELVRVLAPGGRLLIEEFDANRAAVRLIALAEKAVGMGSRFLRPQEICEILNAHGLATQVHGRSRIGAWIVADKPGP